jgi:hypothetical protein
MLTHGNKEHREILSEMTIKITVFWDEMPYNLIYKYQHLGYVLKMKAALALNYYGITSRML